MKCLKNSQGGAARHLGDTLDSRFGQRPSSAKWFKSQLENSVKSLTVFAATAFELGQEFQAEATAFAEGHFDQAHAAANKAIQDNLKQAPQGSEVVVSAVKAAVDASNKALAEARKSAKKTAKLAQEGIAKLKEHAPQVAKAPARRKARA